jgi:hypothetical protein
MSKLNLSRLWYIFPPEDQELKAHEFERKVASFLRNLSLDHKLAVLDFLTLQYAAFQQQLQLMFSRAVLSRSEYSEHSERLRHHMRTVRACRQIAGLSPRGDSVPAADNASFGLVEEESRRQGVTGAANIAVLDFSEHSD